MVPMLWSSVRMISMLAAVRLPVRFRLVADDQQPHRQRDGDQRDVDQWTALSPHGCSLGRTVVHEACTMAGR